MHRWSSNASISGKLFVLSESRKLRRLKLWRSSWNWSLASVLRYWLPFYTQIIFKHDASRIIQCCLKYGDQEQKNAIAEELKNDIVAISKSQYGKFIVSKILRFCKEYRTIVITSFYGQVRKLIRHKDASAVIEECYIQFCNAAQRNALLQEFYGAEFMLFKVSPLSSHL
jgi:hypothetical protein